MKEEEVNEALNLSKGADNVMEMIYRLIDEAINEAIKEELGRIVELVNNQPGITRFALIESSRKSKASVERYLKMLRENNLIIYIGSKKTGGYYLTDKINQLLN